MFSRGRAISETKECPSQQFYPRTERVLSSRGLALHLVEMDTDPDPAPDRQALDADVDPIPIRPDRDPQH